jgi:hypothetical protein
MPLPAPLLRVDDETAVVIDRGLTLDAWATRYLDSGLAAEDCIAGYRQARKMLADWDASVAGGVP